MTQPDVIGNDGERRRGFRAVVVLIAVALSVVAVLKAVHGGGAHDSAMPSAMPTAAPTPAPTLAPTLSAVRRSADVIVRSGDELDVVQPDELHQLATVPFRATDVQVTTLPAFAPGEQVVHVFGLAGGNAFRLEINPAETLRDDLGPASGVLETHEAPVLVHAGDPVTVSGPYGLGETALPRGWQPAGFETLDYAGILTRPADAGGDVEIASWSPGGDPQVLATSGRLLGVTDGGQAVWLDPSCPSGPRCVLFFGDIAGLHPAYGMQAPAGVWFVHGPVAYGSDGYLAVTAKWVVGPDLGKSVLVLVDPWQGTARVVPGSDGVVSSAGVFWADGHDLAFVVDDAAPGVRLVFYDVEAQTTARFGPRLPSGVTLLTAYGAADAAQPVGGVTVRP